jgi:hypothetical protein
MEVRGERDRLDWEDSGIFRGSMTTCAHDPKHYVRWRGVRTFTRMALNMKHRDPPLDPYFDGNIRHAGRGFCLRSILRHVAALVLVGVCGGLVSCSGGGASAPFRFFSPSSFWNQPVVAGAPLDSHSTEVIGMLGAEIAAEEQAKNGPWINTTSYSVPVYTVPAHQQTVSVQLDHHAPDAALSSAWSAVPLPPDAQPAAGTDAVLVVSQPSTDRLWEFWRLAHEADGWHASWGGAMQNVSSDSGVYGPDAWPGAKPWWGSSASSLSLVGGLISFEDLKRGEINHALSMSTPDVRAGVYASPAQRDDGKSTDLLSLPEGAHLRLNPNLNLASLHLPPLTLMIAEAAQRYGIFVRDRAQNVAFYAQDPISTPTNPYAPPGGYFEGKYPRELLASFPWSQLELLKMELHDGS